MNFPLCIAAPDGAVFEGEAVQLSVRGTEGSLSVLAGHMPFATATAAGECRIYLPDGTVRHAHSSEGFLSVTREGVRLLVGRFEWRKKS